MTLDPQACPRLPRGVRVAQDKVRGGSVLLAPERALRLDDVGLAVLGEVDGTRTIKDIADILATRYNAPPARILTDARNFLFALWSRRMLDITS